MSRWVASKRGLAMAEAARERPGAMAAILSWAARNDALAAGAGGRAAGDYGITIGATT